MGDWREASATLRGQAPSIKGYLKRMAHKSVAKSVDLINCRGVTIYMWTDLLKSGFSLS